jgi:hypothetical protein
MNIDLRLANIWLIRFCTTCVTHKKIQVIYLLTDCLFKLIELASKLYATRVSLDNLVRSGTKQPNPIVSVPRVSLEASFIDEDRHH